MRTPLKPVKVDVDHRVLAADSPRKVAYWRVTLGKRVTGTRKQRRFFKTYREATEFIEGALAAQKVQGHEAFSIPQKLRVEAMQCEKLLSPLGASLTQAVEYFLKHAAPPGGSKVFAQLCEEFMSSRRAMSCKPRTLVQYESYVAVLGEEFGKVKANEIKPSDIEDWLEEYEVKPKAGQGQAGGLMSPRTRRNYLTTLKTIFNYGLGKGYLAENPASKVPAPLLDDKPIGILSPEIALRLLSVASDEMPEMVPGISIGLFAGLRRSEISMLDWEDVDLAGATIVVQGIISKTRQRRVVTIMPNLAAWLLPHRRFKGPVSFNPDLFGEKLRALVRAKTDAEGKVVRPAILDDWPHNALRHSFGSYFFAKTKNETLTAAEMGNSPLIVHKHYRALVREPEVVRFWALTPPQVLETASGANLDCRPGIAQIAEAARLQAMQSPGLGDAPTGTRMEVADPSMAL